MNFQSNFLTGNQRRLFGSFSSNNRNRNRRGTLVPINAFRVTNQMLNNGLLPRFQNVSNSRFGNLSNRAIIPRGFNLQNNTFSRLNTNNQNLLNINGRRTFGNTIAASRSLINMNTQQGFTNGGLITPSTAVSTDSIAPAASGFSLSNSGERDVTFGKEFVAGFMRVTNPPRAFASYAVTTHPYSNSTTANIAQIYQRYKIMSYHFRYKAACPTDTAGLHYTGVDYGTQTNLPANFDEAESLEHFTVGPIWKDSQNWHVLKLPNLRERWFDIRQNSSDPESRPARIVFGTVGVSTDSTDTPAAFGVIEVRVTYRFNGLGRNFTGEPPSRFGDGMDPHNLPPNMTNTEIFTLNQNKTDLSNMITLRENFNNDQEINPTQTFPSVQLSDSEKEFEQI